VTAPAVERPSPPGSGTGSSAPAGDEAPAGAGRGQLLASAYGRGLAFHRWHRDGDALRLAGQMLLFAIEPNDFVQDPEAEPWPS
jgi:hypothetical protein